MQAIKIGWITSHIRIIHISDNPEHLVYFAECHAEAIIEKPFNSTVLYETIEHALHIPTTFSNGTILLFLIPGYAFLHFTLTVTINKIPGIPAIAQSMGAWRISCCCE